jgi:hypothetical protein
MVEPRRLGKTAKLSGSFHAGKGARFPRHSRRDHPQARFFEARQHLRGRGPVGDRVRDPGNGRDNERPGGAELVSRRDGFVMSTQGAVVRHAFNNHVLHEARTRDAAELINEGLRREVTVVHWLRRGAVASDHTKWAGGMSRTAATGV